MGHRLGLARMDQVADTDEGRSFTTNLRIGTRAQVAGTNKTSLIPVHSSPLLCLERV